MEVARILNSIGKATFVKYFDNFRNLDRDKCIMLFEENYTDNAKSTRTGHAKRIFRENMELEALRLIIASDRVDETTRRKAKEILSREERQ